MQRSVKKEYTKCPLHGLRCDDYKVLATVHFRGDGVTLRVRCRRCHADKELARRHRSLPRNAEYMKAYRKR
jgi:hypothetical protein